MLPAFFYYRFELTDAQAAMLLSLQGNLRISQIVNPLKGCVMELPLRLLHQLKRKKLLTYVGNRGILQIVNDICHK